MKFVYIFCVIIYTASSAPIDANIEHPELRILENEDDLRDKRSHYGKLYVSPCAAAASSSLVQSVAPPPVNFVPVQQYTRPSYGYNYNYPHYRSVDQNENELLSYPDMNHFASENVPAGMEALTSFYPNEPRIAALNSQMPSQPMQSIGVFPYNNPGAVNVPFLFTCSPSIVQGQMVQPQTQYYSGYTAPDRDIDLQSLEPQEPVLTHPEHSPSPPKTQQR